MNTTNWPRSGGPLLLHGLLSPSLPRGLIRSSVWSTDGRREVWGLVYRCFCTTCGPHLKVDGCRLYTTASLWGIPGGWCVGKSFQWAELRRALCSLCLEGEVASDVLIHGLWPVVWLDGQGLGRNMIGKLVTKKLGGKECGWDLSSYSPLPCRSQTTRLLLVPQTLRNLYLPFTPARPLDEVAFPATL